MSAKLDPRPARQLTTREIAKVIGGLLAGLPASGVDIRTAVRWWAETDEAWDAFERLQDLVVDVEQPASKE